MRAFIETELREILRELDYSESEIDALAAAGAVYQL